MTNCRSVSHISENIDWNKSIWEEKPFEHDLHFTSNLREEEAVLIAVIKSSFTCACA